MSEFYYISYLVTPDLYKNGGSEKMALIYLTQSICDKALPEAKRYDLRDTFVRGLFLRVAEIHKSRERIHFSRTGWAVQERYSAPIHEGCGEGRNKNFYVALP